MLASTSERHYFFPHLAYLTSYQCFSFQIKMNLPAFPNFSALNQRTCDNYLVIKIANILRFIRLALAAGFIEENCPN